MITLHVRAILEFYLVVVIVRHGDLGVEILAWLRIVVFDNSEIGDLGPYPKNLVCLNIL